MPFRLERTASEYVKSDALETGDLPKVHVEVSLVREREDGLQTLHELVHYGHVGHVERRALM